MYDAGTASSGELLQWLRCDSILPSSVRERAIQTTLRKVRNAAAQPPSQFQLEVFNLLQVRTHRLQWCSAWYP